MVLLIDFLSLKEKMSVFALKFTNIQSGGINLILE